MRRIAIVNSRTFGVRFPDLIDRLKEYAEVEKIFVDRGLRGKALAEKLRGIHFIVASVTPYYDREFFENNSDVVLIARHGIGVDNVDLEAATEHGVLVTRVPGYRERDAVAELAVALALSAVRMVCNASKAVREGRWGDRSRIVGFNIRGKTVGIIGLGNIGSRVAEIFSRGFNAKVLTYDPYISPEKAREHGAELVSLEELLRESHIISLHVPLTPETYHMIGDKELQLMRDGVIIVNTARGELVDTNALIKALKAGKVGYAVFDVVEGEPIGADHPLLKFENVIVTPHIGANTIEGLRGMDESVVEAILDVINGKTPVGLVNTEVLDKGTRAGLSKN